MGICLHPKFLGQSTFRPCWSVARMGGLLSPQPLHKDQGKPSHRAPQTEHMATGARRRSWEGGTLWLALLSGVCLASSHPHLVVQSINMPGTFAYEPVRRPGFVDISRLYPLCALNLLVEARSAEQTLRNGRMPAGQFTSRNLPVTHPLRVVDCFLLGPHVYSVNTFCEQRVRQDGVGAH